MRTHKKALLFPLVSLLMVARFAGHPLFAKDTAPSVETKIALEESLERRLKSVITQILGNNDVIVIVTAEMYTEDEKKQVEAEPAATSFLPGVPIKEKIGELEANTLALSETRTLIKKMSASIVLDKRVSDADVNVVKSATSGLLGLKPDRGDILEIQRMDFHKGEQTLDWKRFLRPPDLWWTMGLSLMALFMLFLTLFFFGSFRIFIREFVKALKNYGESTQEQIKMMHMQKKFEEEQAKRGASDTTGPDEEKFPSGAGPAASTTPGGIPTDGKTEVPFSFINESHSRNLKFLLKKERPEQIAIILHYLSPALANDILTSLDPAKQSEILLQLASVADMDPEIVKTIEEKIRERIAYVVGGEDRLQTILDYANPDMQQSILSTLSKKDAPMAVRMRQRLFTIDDLVKLDNAVLAGIVRRVNIRILASVLRDTKKEFQDQILSKLPEGSAAMLREEISLAKPVPTERLAQERRHILDTIRRLNERGLIQLRPEVKP
ncbi:MAG TPA: FliG C-terminal domain-containing protein [Elusimicrobiota bacterium]|nr:FliG C-terminal domain-containing protein [Elusimicrobiota bacterium]